MVEKEDRTKEDVCPIGMTEDTLISSEKKKRG